MEPINRDGLLVLYAYNAYANHLVLDGVAQLSEAEFTREFSPSHGSIRGLLLHTLDCEAWFLANCRERQLEIWFSVLQRKCLAHGSWCDYKELERHI